MTADLEGLGVRSIAAKQAMIDLILSSPEPEGLPFGVGEICRAFRACELAIEICNARGHDWASMDLSYYADAQFHRLIVEYAQAAGLPSPAEPPAGLPTPWERS